MKAAIARSLVQRAGRGALVVPSTPWSPEAMCPWTEVGGWFHLLGERLSQAGREAGAGLGDAADLEPRLRAGASRGQVEPRATFPRRCT